MEIPGVETGVLQSRFKRAEILRAISLLLEFFFLEALFLYSEGSKEAPAENRDVYVVSMALDKWLRPTP